MYPPPGIPPLPGAGPGGALGCPDDSNPRSNAFADADGESTPCSCCYFGAGFMGLRRQGLGHGVIAVLDPGNGVDTGIPPPATASPLIRFSDISPDFNWGARATLGYRCGADSIEATGFYLGMTTFAKQVALPGKIDLPFSAFNPPLGFTGDNGLWLQADLVRTYQQTRIANGEINYRYCYCPNFDWILGIRYLDLQEGFAISTSDDDITLGNAGFPANPFNDAIYTISTHNRIVAPQFGLACDQLLVDWLSVTLEGKAALGANFFSYDHMLIRFDGFQGPSSHRATTLFSQVYEVNLFANLLCGEHVRVRAGYQALWVVGIPVAEKQVDFDPNNALGHHTDHGSLFFHGPAIEVQFAF
jgi:hypothetical protein